MICAALHCLCRLAEISLHARASLLDIGAKIAPLLCHPHSAVRHGALGFFGALGPHFADAEVYCFLRPMLRPYLSVPLTSLDQVGHLMCEGL